MIRLLFAISVLVLLGCNDQIEDLTRIDDVRYQAEYAIPLVDSEVNLSDLIGEDSEGVSLSVDPDGLLRFRYAGNLEAVNSDVIFGQLDPIARGIFLPITERSQEVPLVLPGDIDLNELRLGSGFLVFDLPNRYDRPVRVSLSIPSASLAGETLLVTAELPAYSGTGPPPAFTNAQNPIDLSGYVLNLANASTDLVYTIDALDGTELAPSQGTVAAFTDLKFTYVDGYLGQAAYEGERDTIAIGVFDRYQEGEIFFADPTITVTLSNSFGLPARAVIDALNVIDVDGNVLPVTGQAITDGFDFNYPLTPGNSATTSFTFDRSNTNLPEVLSLRPVAVDIAISAIINPEADTTITGFLTDSSAYSATVAVELPLVGSATDFTIRDTIPLDLAGEYENLTAVTFRLTTDNSLPLDLQLSGTFFDAQGNPLADLTQGELTIIRAGTQTPTQVISDIIFGADRVELIRRATQLVLATSFSTAGGGAGAVRITEEQGLRVRLGALLTVDNR